MAIDVLQERTSCSAQVVTQQWHQYSDKYECRVVLCPEEEGGYSAHALRLPGVVSEGETEKEALDNVSEAFVATLQTYISEGMPIPWEDVEVEQPKGSKVRWILVNV